MVGDGKRPGSSAGLFDWRGYLQNFEGKEPDSLLDDILSAIDMEDGSGRTAVDLGFGVGAETQDLLERGFTVFAVDGEQQAGTILRARVSADLSERLTIVIGSFEDVELPKADLVLALMSLPYGGAFFEAVVQQAVDAVAAGGYFVGKFFGPDDDWIEDGVDIVAITPGWVKDRFSHFPYLSLWEQDFTGQGGYDGGDKRWHVYTVIAGG